MYVPFFQTEKTRHKQKMYHEVDDLPSGPLDIYRRKASFNWKDMLNFLEEEEIQTFKVVFISTTVSSDDLQIPNNNVLVIFEESETEIVKICPYNTSKPPEMWAFALKPGLIKVLV